MEIEGVKTTIPAIIPYANVELKRKNQPDTNEAEFMRAVDMFNKNGHDLMSLSTRGVLFNIPEVVDNILKERGTFQEPPKTITIEELIEKIYSQSYKRYTKEKLIDALVEWKTINGKDFLTLLPGLINIRLKELIPLLNKTGGSRRKYRKSRKSRKSRRYKF